MALAAVPAASAHDHRPPGTKLHVAGFPGSQEGLRVEANWIQDAEVVDGQLVCSQLHETSPFRFPQAFRVEPGMHSARIEFLKEHEPDGLSLDAWTEIDKQGKPVGDSESIPFTLVPRTEGAEVVAWSADFPLELDGDYFIRADGNWSDEQGCGGSEQSALWTFHVSSDPPPTCDGREATIEAMPGGLTVRGTDDRDVIVGTPGDDVLLAKGGDDLICAKDGDDEVNTGKGDDEVAGGAESDELRGQRGRDHLFGRSGSDDLHGGSRVDLCRGGAGRDDKHGCER